MSISKARNALFQGIILVSIMTIGCTSPLRDNQGDEEVRDGFEVQDCGPEGMYNHDVAYPKPDITQDVDASEGVVKIEVKPDPISFGFVPKGQTGSVVVAIKNAGSTGILNIYSVHLKKGSSPDFSITQPTKKALSPNETTHFKVLYKPSDYKADSGTLVVESNAVTSTMEVAIKTLPPGIMARAVPPLEFGNVCIGKQKVINTRVVDSGSTGFKVKKIALALDSSKAFKVLSTGNPPDLPVSLSPNPDADPNGTFIPLSVQFAPVNTGDARGKLNLTVEVNNPKTGKPEDQTLAIDIHGVGMGPKVVASPDVLDFGYVAVNQKKTLTLKISNTGTEALIIHKGGVYPTQGSDAGLTVDDAPAQALTINPGGAHEFHVSWEPAAPPPNPDLGKIAVEGNGQCPVGLEVPVKGLVVHPVLDVPKKVDFGFVTQAATVKKTLVLKNTGHADLVVHSIELKGDANNEFEIQADTKFPPTTGGGDATIKGGSRYPVTLTFTNKGAPSGDAHATLTISSNSYSGNTAKVDLLAHRAGKPECRPVILPPLLNYGTVSEHGSKTLAMHIRNVGTGPCTIKDVGVWDCSNDVMGPKCPQPFGSGPQSTRYQIMALPPFILDGLAPGGEVDVPIKFTPPADEGSIFGQFNEQDALFAVQFYNKDTQTTTVLPAPERQQWKANLKGKSGTVNITASPFRVDFGVVNVGCDSRTAEVCIYNTGSAQAGITDINMDRCSPEFHLENAPGLPVDVTQDKPTCFEINYSPQDEGSDACNIVISTNSGITLYIGLAGAGVPDTHQVDKFTQVSGQDVDILFVIDDSGSMSDKQQKLRDSIDNFIKQAKTWHNDYHLGVIDVCVNDARIRGKLNLGAANKVPRYITPQTPDGLDLFKKYVLLGDTESCSDARESGLEAAQSALSAPLLSDTGKACTQDSDCTGAPKVCPNPDICPYRCIDGTCAGWNTGFLRKDAQLEVIVLSDEEDQSRGSPGFYTNFFKAIKGKGRANLFHWNSIVGVDETTGDCQQGCIDASGAQAEHGCRYAEVSHDTNGQVGSICAEDYSSVMQSIGAQAFKLKRQFFLSGPANPVSITVSVNGKDCGTGYIQNGEPTTPGWNWRYDQPSNSVIFEDKGKCMPQPGDQVVIEYDRLCQQ